MNNDELYFKVRRLNVHARRLVEGLLAGKYLSVFKGPGLEFDRVREYEYGDDTRFVDWNVSSRMNSIYSKTFREERELILMILVDVSPSIYPGVQNTEKRETAGMLFSLLALTAVENSDRVGSIMFSDDIECSFPPMKGRRHVLSQVSEVLGHQTRGRGSDLALALRTAGQTLKRPSIVFIISDFRCTNYQHELALLARRHDVIAVRVFDRTDRGFPPVGLVELQDPESGESFEVFGRSRTFQHRYVEFRDDLKRDWLDICRRVGVDTLEMGAEQEIAGSLESFFRRRKKIPVNRFSWCRLGLTGFLLGLCVPVFGQVLRFEPHTFFVGDTVDLRINLNAELGLDEEIRNPIDLPASDFFDIHSAKVEKIGGETEIIISFTSYAPGTRVLPPIRFGTLLVKDILVPVSSISRGNLQPFRSIRGQVFLPGTGLFTTLILIMIVSLPLLVSNLWRVVRDLFRQLAHFYQSRLPAFILRRRMRVLRSQLGTSPPVEWYSHLTNYLKNYISAKTKRECQSATTEEITMLMELSIPESLRSRISVILREADLVKFAGRPVESAMLRKSLDELNEAVMEWEKIRVQL